MSLLNNIIVSFVKILPKSVVHVFAKKYIAGSKLSDAIEVARKLNSMGICATLDVLGEAITTREESIQEKEECFRILEQISENNLDANLSIKPTSLGLSIDKEFFYSQMKEVLNKAKELNNFVRIDMEDSPCTDMEIDMYRRLKKEFPNNVGLVVQSYLKRTHQDIKDLKDLHSEDAPVNLRVCKGIYVEPEEIAYKNYDEVNEHFVDDIELMLKEGMYPGIATHDIPVVEGAYKLIEKLNIPKDKYEFQMLYGVTPTLRKSIVDQGHRMRVYVPFGEHWFGYCTRRVKENPQMAGVLIKALFKKG